MATRPKLITAKELLLMPDNDMQHELIRGVLTEDILPGDQHGIAVARIGWLLGNFSDDNDFGEVSGRSGFLLERNPDTVRCPDLVWVASGRLDRPVPGYAELAPRPGGGSTFAQRFPVAHGGKGDDVAFPRRADGSGGRPRAGHPSPSTAPASRHRFWASSTHLTGAMYYPASPPRSGASSAAGSSARPDGPRSAIMGKPGG